ncbi:primosomal protein DnaI [Spiroplasma helicoides]|uniref:Primosomal protein DnaI n=1 Tax=Spiroplasma helicoides TaxID=216938 RepID=A0A1B3SLD0_9MOLU|nr:DnaA/Hda family protein [Spiroplasma helicoides]AOG60741.1 primosomal protein DnaI [Spiroplasma helicoides]
MDKDIEALKKNKSLQFFIKEMKVSDEIIKRDYLTLEKFVNQAVVCNKNEGMDKCKQQLKGIQQKLAFQNNQFYIKSQRCNHWLFENKNHQILENIKYADYDLNENLNTLHEYVVSNNESISGSQMSVLYKLKDIVESEKYMKGLYLFGNCGVGKTYLLKMVANSFAKKNKQVVFVTVNRLIKIVKDTFNSSERDDYNKFLDLCYKVDVLVLDDIGGEITTGSSWSRDELLFGLLNSRLENKKTTFFTSNFNLVELEKLYLSKKNLTKEETAFEAKKVHRFIERIKGLTQQMELKGVNKRY